MEGVTNQSVACNRGLKMFVAYLIRESQFEMSAYKYLHLAVFLFLLLTILELYIYMHSPSFLDQNNVADESLRQTCYILIDP